jgi:hypothetical protein
MSGCKHDCERPPVFPKTIENRPALRSIDYRIGTYSRMREHMLDILDKSTTLSTWTHRGADDPGIALLEGTAIIGDILTYYQNLYSNEAFLRTANWRESVSELVRMLGYRLAPGVGGEAIFALKVKGENAVTVPRGFGIKAKLKDQDEDAEFETTEEITAYPHLSKFNLYCPPQAPQSIKAGDNQLELLEVGSKKDLPTLTAFHISKGDRIILVPNMPGNGGTSYSAQDKTEILIVKEVKTVLNRVVITFEGSLTVNRGNTVSAYIIARTFRHFGHNAATKLNKYDGTSVTQTDTIFARKVKGKNKGDDYYSELTQYEMPLNQEVDDLALGGLLVCQGMVYSNSLADVPFTDVKEIVEVRADTLKWADINSPTTVVTLKNGLMENGTKDESMDIRKALFHEAISPELTLGALTAWTAGEFTDGNLQFFGTYAEVKALAERNLLLVDTDNNIVQAVSVNSKAIDFDKELMDKKRDDVNQWMWEVHLDSKPQFERSDFSQTEPKITVYGNPVRANQGKTEKEVVLGSGDNRQTFQTFAIPKKPLTYLLDASRSPAQVPEVKIYVEDILWKQVDNLLYCAADEHAYVVRQDHEEKSWVQFGDGKTGARLPSGKNNVKAVFRTGNGATGPLEVDAKPQATGKLKGLEEVFMPGQAVGGDDAEDEDNARTAAPGKLQSLGRLVGLNDYEAEALALPGVGKVRADWAAPGGVPQVRLVVLTKSGTIADAEKVRNTMMRYNRCRGAGRFPVTVVPGVRQYIYLKVHAGYEASRRQVDVENAIKEALGLTGEEGNGIDNDEGLFGLKARRFGQGAHISQIMGAVQQVAGVTWVEVKDAQALNLGSLPETDPTKLSKPGLPPTSKLIGCLPTRILVLHTLHFDLNLVMDETKKECS